MTSRADVQESIIVNAKVAPPLLSWWIVPPEQFAAVGRAEFANRMCRVFRPDIKSLIIGDIPPRGSYR